MPKFRFPIGLITLFTGILFLFSVQCNHTQAPSQKDNSNVEEPQNSANDSTKVVYKNEKYGFQVTLPAHWQGYKVEKSKWQGTRDGKQITGGTIIHLKNPKSTQAHPWEDIPIMVLTQKQWENLDKHGQKENNKESFHIGAAPIPPGKIGENKDYVFATPARYTFDELTGVEEVIQIVKENTPLKTF